MKEKVPIALEELKKKRQSILRESAKKQEENNTLGTVALWITDHVGTMGFFLVIFIWTVGWLGWNVFAPKSIRFDPYPGFVLWLFMSNMIQLFLMPLIMLGQNIQARQAEIRSVTDLKINVQAALENEVILLHLENQNEIMMELLKNIRKEI
jgi:uncharacterized membrane protein